MVMAFSVSAFTVPIPVSQCASAKRLRHTGRCRNLCMSENSTVVSKEKSVDSGKRVENLVIIGSGPAASTAAIYAGRANLKPVILEGVSAGLAGGQLMTTSDVDNFPGFPNGVAGPELMANMRKQALKAGAEIITDDATCVSLTSRPFSVETASSGMLLANAIIVATGASARRLGLAGEDIFWSRGISACAICDGAAPIFAGQELAVVGGGDSACEEAVYLTKYATRVHLLVRGEKLRAAKILQDRVFQHPNVTVHFNTLAVEALGAGQSVVVGGGSPLRAIRCVDGKSGQESELLVRGLFYAIGHEPNTGFLRESGIALDDKGYIKTKPGVPSTNIEGVYAAGDVADKEWRQAVTACGTGCMAALSAERYLSEHALITEYKHTDEAVGVPGQGAVEATESEPEKRVESRGPDDKSSYSIDDTWHKGQYALRKLYHESDRPLIVKYLSPNCGPCAQLKRMLHPVIRSMEGRVHFVEIDVSVDADIAESAGITGTPTVQLFYEKSLVKELRGVRMKSEYKRIIESCLQEA